MSINHLDFETRSEADLNAIGAYAYAMHPSTQIMCLTVGSDPEHLTTINGLKFKFNWGETTPFFDWTSENVHITAHNAPFEYAIYNLILHRRFGWPPRWDPKLWGCTLARAAQVGLPLGLDQLSRSLKVKTPKDLMGRRTMLQLCKPILPGVFDEDPEKYDRLCQYNRNDVLTEMEVDALLPELVPHERAIWEHDLVANRRGIAVDLELAKKAAGFADHVTTRLNARLLELTGGGVTKASQVVEIKRWIGAQGLDEFRGPNPDELGRVAIKRLLDRKDVPEHVKEVIRIRQQVGKSSTAKYRKTIEAVCPDGRVRGVLQYHAAHTGRYGGRLIQPQNYPHGFKPAEQKVAIDLILNQDVEAFVREYGDKSMDALADTLRGTIVAGPGKVLVCPDFTAIEACVLMRLADEEAAVAILRTGKKPYIDLACDIYRKTGLTKEANPQEYDVGKRAFLGFGYGMGEDTFQKNVYEETAKRGKPLWLPTDLCKRAKDAYRDRYSGVVRLWRELEAAAISAVVNPGTNYLSCGGRVIWGLNKDRRFLVAKLPSGRFLWYYHPEVKMIMTPWEQLKPTFCYWGEHPKTKQWALLKTYGGLLAENVSSAIARDIMTHGMQEAEKIPDVHVNLTVHDEVVGEALDPGVDGHAKLFKTFTASMCGMPDWGREYPVNAEGWIGYRYHKE